MTYIKNIWLVFIIIFTVSFSVFIYYSVYNWNFFQKIMVKDQQTQIKLFSNSVRAFIESQDSLLKVLGGHLVNQSEISAEPVHSPFLDNTMELYVPLFGLGLVSYDGRPLVASSDFDLNQLPNLMVLEETQASFKKARISRQIHTAPTYLIQGLESTTYVMPIIKAIYKNEGDRCAVAVMTADILLDEIPIFKGYKSEIPYQNIDVIRGDQFPVFTTDEMIKYAKPIDTDYFDALLNNTAKDSYFNLFYFSPGGLDTTFQVVTHYDSFLDFWFVSKVDKGHIAEMFLGNFFVGTLIFCLYNIVLLLLTTFIAKTEGKRQRKFYELANQDALTGLPNRTMFYSELKRTVSRKYQSEMCHAVLFLDIDDFKTINDTNGHEYGDALLKEASRRIQSCIDYKNTLARFGGDEFIVLLSELSESPVEAEEKAQAVAEMLRIELFKGYELGLEQYNSSVSIGIVVFSARTVNKVSDLLRQADIAVYRAKHLGKNLICLFDPKMQSEVRDVYELENDLHSAIGKDQFHLVFQPQIDTRREVFGAESLIRWSHPKRGVLNPYQFIPIAEKSGLIIPIGKWVLSEACKHLRAWQKVPNLEHLSLSVNISYQQMRDSEFVDYVKNQIHQHSIKASRLHLELTETMFVDNVSETIDKMNELRDVGVRFSLDDFGTGYSSLKYLKQLPFSQLKIDRSFIRDLETDRNDQSIVKTIVSMSEALGFDVIAEGVETSGQRSYLISKGCVLHQGYMYSKPLDIEGFLNFISQGEWCSFNTAEKVKS